MRDRRVGQSEAQQLLIPKSVIQLPLEFVVFGHGRIYDLRFWSYALGVGIVAVDATSPNVGASGWPACGEGSAALPGAAPATAWTGGAGGFRPCSRKAATSCWTASSWLSCKLGSAMVNKSPVRGCS